MSAAEVGVAPPVRHTIDPEGALVCDFVNGELMHPDAISGHPERIRQIVATIKVAHDRAVFRNEIRIFEMLRRYAEIADEVGATLFPGIEEMLRVCADIEAAMERDVPRPVAAHNDLFSENFIVDADERIWVIDREYGGTTDLYFGLGDFVMEHPFTREEQRLVLKSYCGHMDEHRFTRMMLHRFMSATWWAVWATIQQTLSQIELDYVAWGTERLRRARDTRADPDHSRWMAVV